MIDNAFNEEFSLHLRIKPIGVIKKSNAGLSDVIIYSDFERIIGSIMEKFEKGMNLLIVHKNNKSTDEHQVRVSAAELINRKGNLLTVKGIEADDDSVIDVRLKNEI
ncbi:MAG: hypothetical protein OIN88_06070 [Candidatus Methanoperedens sp.]|nr:hypothetical protein [Candidatus Methanoperedens sp.]MCZ7360526.1 hypothetical protein [Candidatus Methanoperedens sp.]HLB70047.1 hypothetical protein [Candidatus Methanoperedens sp.]